MVTAFLPSGEWNMKYARRGVICHRRFQRGFRNIFSSVPEVSLLTQLHTPAIILAALRACLRGQDTSFFSS